MMKLLVLVFLGLVSVGCDNGAASATPDSGVAVLFERFPLSTQFFAEGATFGDFNRDGVADAVAGPYWYEGPTFQLAHPIYPALPFDPKGYSDNFFAFVRDFDGDAWDDILIVGFPGQDARWYRNPADSTVVSWQAYPAFGAVDNEAPCLVDLTGQGRPELVFSTAGQLGWAEPNQNPYATWTFHALSPVGPFQVFTHGLRVGDMDKDGDNDVLEATGWWEQPDDLNDAVFWKKHPQAFGAGGAQMFALDVDGDGDQDVVTTLSAHGSGLAWFERRDDTSGTERFVQHAITSAEPGGEPLHEPHALALADMNGDGLADLVTGERFWGHVPAGDPDYNAPARLMWFGLQRRAADVVFIPHLIDAASGVGTQVVARDIDGDGRPDIVVSNKKGAFVFRQARR